MKKLTIILLLSLLAWAGNSQNGFHYSFNTLTNIETLLQTSDSGFVINTPGALLKLDRMGNVLWQKIYQSSPITKVREIANGRLVLAGFGEPWHTTAYLDSEGDTLWMRAFDVGWDSTAAYEELLDIGITNTHDILVSQWNFIIKLDTLGSVKWMNRYYDQNGPIEIRGILPGANGESWLTYGTSSSLSIAKIDTSGNVILERTYANVPGMYSGIRASGSGGFFIIATPPSQNDFYFLRFDSAGSILASTKSIIPHIGQVSDMWQDQDGSYRALLHTYYLHSVQGPTYFFWVDGYLLKTDSNVINYSSEQIYSNSTPYGYDHRVFSLKGTPTNDNGYAISYRQSTFQGEFFLEKHVLAQSYDCMAFPAGISFTATAIQLQNDTSSILLAGPAGYPPYPNSGNVVPVNSITSTQLCFTGTEETSDSNQIYLHPNPANERITIKGMNKEGEILLMDMLGQVVLAQAFESESQLDLTRLPSGIYLVRVIDGIGRILKAQKVVIAH
jgi:hypothetical protein